ncbi:MAG: hypothetical protein Q8O08_08530 [Methyloversatilis sp.]|uniref:hypothetical protein n=1 Tax=Methyloversatilis sp. TaxID=2569862 RepID=UPI0027339B5B|nr:hypothetical protein [Methyloversatilis sp.]MDP2868859.1 hypothetical protein [Methyloversatilis sp.]MDP3457480.1 hypothetical protein [Methyloversatilis sp.]MDP3579339.1 hypothetical protein [Methyloversatilis sp.]
MRTLALIAAIGTVVGVWLTIEWLAHADRPDTTATQPAEVAPAAPAPAASPPRAHARPVPQIEPDVRGDAIYKCTVAGSTVYADAPCGEQARTVALPPPSAGLSPDRSYAEQLARVRAERARHAATHPAPSTDIARRPSSDNRCASIDETVKAIDAATRQPHDVPAAEHFRARRRSLMDERFTLGCNG